MQSYAGIGSRDITQQEMYIMIAIAGALAERSWMCYTGDAKGSDAAFLRGSRGHAVVYVPSQRAIKNLTHTARAVIACGDTAIGREWMMKAHPSHGHMQPHNMPYIIRDAHQVIGYDPWPAVQCVICCADPTHDGSLVAGGTGQAVRIATQLGIPVFNIRDKRWVSDPPTILPVILDRFPK